MQIIIVRATAYCRRYVRPTETDAMTNNSDIVFTPAARHVQAQHGSAHAYAKRIAAGFPDRGWQFLALWEERGS